VHGTHPLRSWNHVNIAGF